MNTNFKFNSIADAINKGEKKSKIKKSDLLISFSYSNAKLKDTRDVKFIQWNILAIVTCPFKTNLCGGKDENGKVNCYAYKCERYPSVKNRRSIHTEATKRDDFVEIMIEQIEYELKSTKKTIFFRIHESGDFYNYEYLEKWYFIAKHFEGNNRIIFEAYTKSLPYFKELYSKYGKDNVNIKVLSSIWADTKKEMIELTKELNLKVYTAIDGKKMSEFLNNNKDFEECKCSACGECKKCYTSNINLIVAIH